MLGGYQRRIQSAEAVLGVNAPAEVATIRMRRVGLQHIAVNHLRKQLSVNISGSRELSREGDERRVG